MIELEDYELEDIQRILALTQMIEADVKLMEHYIRTYIDHKCHVCTHCSSQIRFAHKRLSMWYVRVIEPTLK